MQMLHFRVPTSCNGMRLNIFLRTMGVSSACIKAVKYQGTGFCVRLGDEVIPVHTDYRVATAQIVSFALPPEPPTDVQPEPLPIDVIYEDEFAAVLNKPAGIAVHPTLNHTSGTLANGWLYRLKCRGEDGVFRPVNRIDKNTSGLLMVAKNDHAHLKLSEQIQAHTFTRAYQAIAVGRFSEKSGTIHAPIGRHPVDRKKMCVTQKNSKDAITHYTVLAESGNYTHLQLQLETGRTHQIRVHLAYLGHPVLGDDVYGKPFPNLTGQCLHAGKIGFIHPTTGGYMEFTSPLPDYFQAALRKLRFTEAEGMVQP